MRYGGNTTCIEVRIGDDIIILDAGTGLRMLGQSLLEEFKRQPLSLTLLISHTHWDHIQGLPFFAPIYDAHCRLRILGGEGARKGLVAALTGQMESTYFPVPFSKLPSNIEIEEMREFNFAVGSTSSAHTGPTIQVFASATGCSRRMASSVFSRTRNRGPGGDDRDMIDFIRDADVLILDSQYNRDEYRQHTGWGHGCVEDSVMLALRAGVKKLILFHHDPSHDDKTIDGFVRHARALVKKEGGKMKVEAAREGMAIQLNGKSLH